MANEDRFTRSAGFFPCLSVDSPGRLFLSSEEHSYDLPRPVRRPPPASVMRTSSVGFLIPNPLEPAKPIDPALRDIRAIRNHRDAARLMGRSPCPGESRGGGTPGLVHLGGRALAAPSGV